MKISSKCTAIVKEFEGFRKDAYLCPAGVWTYGYGSTTGVKKGDCISSADAEKLLEKELNDFASKVERLLKVRVNQNQFDALVSFAYNVGIGALSSSTLLRYLNAGNYKAAADQFPRWNKSKGKVLAGLTHRRTACRELFLL